MKSLLLLLLFLVISSAPLIAQPVQLKNFVVKENLLKNGKLAVIATDENEKPEEAVNGTFKFDINGFTQELKFHDGVAVTPQPIDKSTFVYFKHKSDSTSKAKLYYVLKRDSGLNPIGINWTYLILIPLALVVIASIFRKFIVFAIIIIMALFLFNARNGLSLPNFFDTIIEGLKSSIF